MRQILTGCAIAALTILAFSANADARSIAPGGCVWIPDPEGGPPNVCPLEHTEVAAKVSGSIARVTVTQRFGNPYTRPIEATYTFPLSERAAVDRMRMEVGDRVIRGVVKEKGEARRIYEEARDRGQVASLLDQERPNIFTQSVANIMPGESIEITLSYVEYLPYEDGEYTFSFPMTVGPRYNPSSVGTADANRITPPVAPRGERAGHDIALEVLVDAGAPIRNIASELHAVHTEQPGNNRAIVRLKNQNEIPNRDFILKYAVASDEIGDALLTHQKDRNGYFTLMLHPPARVTPENVAAKEMIFIIDSSGSMSGFPIEKAKKTMRLCIENMNPNDTFNLVTFAGGLGYCFPEAVENTTSNRDRALAFLEKLRGGGGTEMMPAVRAALSGPYTENRLRVVCFMTDGFIGNDMQILGEIRKSAASARVFAFGIGSSVNRFLIEGMAREGRGAAEVVTLESGSAEAAERFYERIHSPVLTDISIDFGNLPVTDIYPPLDRLPDLFSSQPIMVTGRYTRSAKGSITVHGSTADGRYRREVDVNLPAKAVEHDVLAPLWARARIDALMAEDWQGMQQGNPGKNIKRDITQLGIDYSLVTQFTSFVAVEERVVNRQGRPQRVEVPVEIPDGVSHEGVGLHRQTAQALPAPPATPMPAARRNLGRAYSDPAKVGAKLRPSIASSSPAPLPAPKPAPEPAPILEESVEYDASPADKAMEKKESRDDIAKDELASKIDPALHNLLAKLERGEAKNELQAGKLEVLLTLTSLSTENLRQLRDAGVEIIAERHAVGVVLAKITPQQLRTIARLAFVEKVEAANNYR